MYPDKPKKFDVNSQEDIMFNALEKLPDTYYVFHSFSIVNVVDDTIYESETDFVIFHPEKGILCLEAKAGRVKYEKGEWVYGSGIPMSHDGPFNQARMNKWKLSKYIQSVGLSYLLKRCKLIHAVWFPSISKDYFEGVNLPAEADVRLMLTKDSMDDIETAISGIFDVKLPNHKETSLGNKDIQNILDKVLAPTFNLISLAEMKLEHRRQVFKVMLKEQIALLNYLEEQDSAVINGMAGTGKTVMAIEKAKRHADRGENVLFLCYNLFLKEHLQEAYAHEKISYYTIDGLACKLCNTSVPDYELFQDLLQRMYKEGTFPFRHIIIDEGQDFGREKVAETDIIELLKSNVLDDEKKGTFYLFYDKNQMVQSEKMPNYISEADCKLTLYRNCRNTENIATTSLRLLGSDKMPKLFEGAIIGDSPELYLANEMVQTISTLNQIIDKNWENGYTDIRILTCKTESNSIIANECSTGVYLYKGRKIPFTTCRKYKGLEADSIIIVDMDKTTFEDGGEQIMYVGASRARYKLSLIAELSNSECELMLDKLSIKKAKKPGKALAAIFNAKYKELD